MSETTRHPAFNPEDTRTPHGNSWRREHKRIADAWRARWRREYAYRWVKRANGCFPVDQYSRVITVKVYGCAR